MRWILLQVAVLACLWLQASFEEAEDDEAMYKDLMVGRLWEPGNDFGGGESSGKESNHEGFNGGSAWENGPYQTMFANYDDSQGPVPESPSKTIIVANNDANDEEDNGQNDDPDDDEVNDNDQGNQTVPMKKEKGSLGIVFDTTGSMAKELKEVKKGAKAIVEALNSHPNAPIYNYIFSPFNDPKVGPLTITTEYEVLGKKMKEIIVGGGGDCPEPTLTGLKNALEVCLPNSKIFVFTDAPAKDFKLYKSIITLVQRKRAEVNFIITPGCMEKNLNKLWVYDYIAQTSSGHLYKIKKADLKNVLNYVKMALKPDVVNLMSVNKVPPQNSKKPVELTIPVDSSMKEFTISISGLDAKMDLMNPSGQSAGYAEHILNLNHLKVFKVKAPETGVWKASVKCSYPYMVRVTGISNLNFFHGFSIAETDNLKNTNYRPLRGGKSHILIQTTDMTNTYTFKKVEILNLRGGVISTLPLKPVESTKGLYRANDFTPTNQFFHMRIVGVNKAGEEVSRITSTAISPQKPGPPIVTMRTTAVRRADKPGSISCNIESQVPVTIGWKKNGQQVDSEQTCSEACEAILHFKIFTVKSEGNYTCHATNSAGQDEKTLRLYVGNAPFVAVNTPVNTLIGESVRLVCNVKSEFPATVRWSYIKDENSNDFRPVTWAKVLSDHTLDISSVNKDHFGWYACIARSRAGTSIGKIQLMLRQ